MNFSKLFMQYLYPIAYKSLHYTLFYTLLHIIWIVFGLNFVLQNVFNYVIVNKIQGFLSMLFCKQTYPYRV